MTPTPIEQLKITTEDNHIIPIFYYPAANHNPKAVIQINHGMAEHHIYYQDFIHYFTQIGYDIYIHDQRGHGMAASTPDSLGYNSDENGTTKLINDCISITQLIIEKNITTYNKQLPIILFGHSMGALIALSAVIKTHRQKLNYYQGIILTGCPGIAPYWECIVYKFLLNIEIVRQSAKKYGISPIAKFIFNYMFNWPFRKEKKLFAWVTRNQYWLDKFLADPKAGFVVKNQYWLDVIDLLENIKNNQNIKQIHKNLPIIMLDGQEDSINHQTKRSQKLYNKLKSHGITQLKHIIYPQARHHLILEPNRHEIFKDIETWLEKTLEKTSNSSYLGYNSFA